MTRARELAELGSVYDNGALSNRNFVINGAMQVWQRGTSFSNSNLQYNADLIAVDDNQGGGGQSTDAPDGFTYSLKVDPGSGLNAAIRHPIELPAAGEGGVFRSGQKFTLSFYLKSDNAGEAINIFVASSTTKGGTTTNHVTDTSTGLTTTTSWTRYTYTFTSNNVGGSDTCYNLVPYVTTPSGAVYWTGLQLELGTEATPFEHRSFGDELARCQRYTHVYAFSGTSGNAGFETYRYYSSTNGYSSTYNFPVTMRSAPSATIGSTPLIHAPVNTANAGGTIAFQSATTQAITVTVTPTTDYGANQYTVILNTGNVIYSAEF